MKGFYKATAALLVGTMMTVGAQAAISGMTGSPYVGVKAGKFMVDEDGLDDLNALGGVIGYQMNPNVGIEAEYNGSKEKSIKLNDFDVDYSFKNYGVYGTYRYDFNNTNLYAKGKLGLAKAEAKATATKGAVSSSAKESDTGVAGGLGLGYQFTPNIAIEGEYAIITSDVDALTIGAKYQF